MNWVGTQILGEHGQRSSMVLQRQVLGFAMAVLLTTPLPCFGTSATYSDASASGPGGRTVYGWGVTDVTNYTYFHTAYVSTTLRSPTGRTASSGTRSARNSIRADVSLDFSYEEGDFTVSSTHSGYCLAMGWFIYNFPTGDGIHIGHSENWFKYHHYDSIIELCIYLIIPNCTTACQANGEGNVPQCYDGHVHSTHKQYIKAWYYWWNTGGSSEKHCFFVEVQKGEYDQADPCSDTS